MTIINPLEGFAEMGFQRSNIAKSVIYNVEKGENTDNQKSPNLLGLIYGEGLKLKYQQEVRKITWVQVTVLLKK